MSSLEFPNKSPTSVLDYEFDWSDWLATSETITTFDVTCVDDEIVISNEAQASGAVSFILAGGLENHNYLIRCQITTSAGRIDSRSAILKVRTR